MEIAMALDYAAALIIAVPKCFLVPFRSVKTPMYSSIVLKFNFST